MGFSSSSSKVQFFNFRNSLLLCLVLFLHFACKFSEAQLQKKEFLSERKTLAIENEEPPKKKNTIGNKNQTKLIKPTTNSTKTTLSKPIKTTTNSTKTSLFKPIKSTTNSTKTTLSKPIKNPTNSTKTTLSKPIKTTSNSTKTHLKNPTSTSNNSTPTKPKSPLNKKSLDLPKTHEKSEQPSLEKKPTDPKPKTQYKSDPKTKTQAKSDQPKPQKTQNKPKTKPTQFSDMETDDEDLIIKFRDLPSKFHAAILPDLEKISTTSKAYLTKANQEISEGFKPLVGHKYAPFIASFISCIFLILPLLLLSLLYKQIRTYFSLQKILIFIQAYLSIYFAILSLSYLATGLEPLQFFYSTSMSSYVSMQIFQALGYVLYLLMQLMGLVVVFSKKNGPGSKVLGLAQMVVGLAVGLHYYVAVFHRAVLYQAPKTNWKVHGIYATCFLVICLFARAERRKKAYLEEGGEGDGKKS
ncbi:uncharacterized protein LOC143848710 [Tasmannia lanceolata]|uniref:uncharacterized protein LOC143848710 n=1 Tax=Tasmannia lanceolata TaxID=3420 RepID=UPI004063A963